MTFQISFPIIMFRIVRILFKTVYQEGDKLKTSTMKDVAQMAGVSVTTVSHVINQSRVVNRDTQEKVMNAIAALHYKPNTLARDLRKKSTKTIALIISDLDNEYFTQIVRVFEKTAMAFGYNCILCNTDEDPDKERLYLNVFVQKQIDGLILVPTCQNAELIAQFVASGLPFVMVDRCVPGINAPYVGIDNYHAAFQTVCALTAIGCRRIDFFCSDPCLSAIQERIAAYRDAMHVYAQDVQDGDICYITGNTRDEIVSQLEAYYASRPLPDAIFVAGNKPLLSVFSFFHKKGIRCPEDVRLIGFGSSRWAAEFQPGISLCCPDVQQIGSAAINLLMEWILALEEDRPIPAPVTKLTQAIIEFRASFGSPEEISRARAAAAACIRTEK